MCCDCEWGVPNDGPGFPTRAVASKLYADASAALCIAKRQGAGKMRHINVKSLWLQEKQVQAELDYEKIKGEENPSDGLTKHVRQELAERYAATVGYKFT